MTIDYDLLFQKTDLKKIFRVIITYISFQNKQIVPFMARSVFQKRMIKGNLITEIIQARI